MAVDVHLPQPAGPGVPEGVRHAGGGDDDLAGAHDAGLVAGKPSLVWARYRSDA
jgi:hypothetical protein